MNRTMPKSRDKSWQSLYRKDISRFLNPNVKSVSGNLASVLARAAIVHGNVQSGTTISEILQMGILRMIPIAYEPRLTRL